MRSNRSVQSILIFLSRNKSELVVNIDMFWAKISLGNVSQAATRLRPAPPESRLKKANANNTKTPSMSPVTLYRHLMIL
jgi:hypothetical protein